MVRLNGRLVLKHINKFLRWLVEDVKLFWYIICFGVAICIFGVLYWHFNDDTGFWESIYISTITISSLGYADIYPLGLSKLIASIQVLLGLTLIGIMLAKLTSRTLSYHISHLFSSEVRRRLEEITNNFSTLEADLTDIASRYFTEYPNQGYKILNDNDFNIRFRKTVNDLKSYCTSFRDEIPYMEEQRSYFRIAPDISLIQAGMAVEGSLYVLVNILGILHNMPPAKKLLYLNRTIRRDISDAINSQKHIYEAVKGNVKNEGVLTAFESLNNACIRIPSIMFEGLGSSQLDRHLRSMDEPQTNEQHYFLTRCYC